MIWLKGYNKKVYLFFSFVFLALLIPSFIYAWSYDEGTLSSEHWGYLFVISFNILRFPSHVLFWDYISTTGPVIFLVSLFANCFFYGLLFERIVYLIKKRIL